MNRLTRVKLLWSNSLFHPPLSCFSLSSPQPLSHFPTTTTTRQLHNKNNSTPNINQPHPPLHQETSKPLHVCVVGSGPSGFYATESLLTNYPNSHITIYEKLPVPFGLVRFGVSPDHPEVKLVQNKFEKLLADNHNTCYFVGNVNVGKDITIEELQRHYHAIILAYGSENEKYLGIKGEGLPGVYSARDFVAWLNGHPDFQNRSFDLTHERIGIIGQGNVALDVARILLRNLKDLQVTDMTDKALEALKHSNVREVHLIGRRGPAQASFTTKELREIFGLPNIEAYVFDASAMTLNEASKNEVATDRAKRRMMELLDKLKPAQPPENSQGKKRLYFHFLRNPVEFIQKEEKVGGGNSGSQLAGVLLEVSELHGEAGHQKSVGTGKYETLSLDAAFRSIGYKAVAMPGVPFDLRSGIVPNEQGRVISEQGHNAGLFVCGWLKRGPSGIIATNKWDAEETVQKILENWKYGTLKQNVDILGVEKLREIIHSKGLKTVTFSEWKRIEAEELKRGKEKGKVMEKITVVEDMLNVIKEGS